MLDGSTTLLDASVITRPFSSMTFLPERISSKISLSRIVGGTVQSGLKAMVRVFARVDSAGAEVVAGRNPRPAAGRLDLPQSLERAHESAIDEVVGPLSVDCPLHRARARDVGERAVERRRVVARIGVPFGIDVGGP